MEYKGYENHSVSLYNMDPRKDIKGNIQVVVLAQSKMGYHNGLLPLVSVRNVYIDIYQHNHHLSLSHIFFENLWERTECNWEGIQTDLGFKYWFMKSVLRLFLFLYIIIYTR